MNRLSTLLLISIFSFGLMTSCNSQAAKQKSTAAPTEKSSNPNPAPAAAKTGVYQNVDAKTFNSMLGKANVVVIDVRTPGEYASGYIKGAKSMNLYDRSFQSNIEQLDKNKTYMVYCRSGARSARAMSTMKAKGISTVYNLQGGIGAWMRAGFPVEK